MFNLWLWCVLCNYTYLTSSGVWQLSRSIYGWKIREQVFDSRLIGYLPRSFLVQSSSGPYPPPRPTPCSSVSKSDPIQSFSSSVAGRRPSLMVDGYSANPVSTSAILNAFMSEFVIPVTMFSRSNSTWLQFVQPDALHDFRHCCWLLRPLSSSRATAY